MDQVLPNVYWIGGSPCSGKSTVADRLAAKHGMRAYRCDEAYYRHQESITPDEHPVFSKLAHASCDELWMRPIPQQVADEIELYREEFPLILADLARFPTTQAVVAEGAALLPELLDRLGVRRRRAIWIVPTERFQWEHYARREWRHEVLAGCADKERAWRNWMERDAGFARVVALEARKRGHRVLTVDGARSVEDTARAVGAWFGLGQADDEADASAP